MDGVGGVGRRKSLQERLGLKGFGCCGATWGIGRPSTGVRDDQDEQGPLQIDAPDDVGHPQTPPENSSAQDCVGQTPAARAGMNLAAALAAERHFRAAQDSDGTAETGPSSVTVETAPGTPFRMSLMRLLEESDGVDADTETETKGREKEERGMGSDSMCCVCMVRKKGAAFIPCGHTFCRVCSRELWLNRGSCPLCNRLILEILDIF